MLHENNPIIRTLRDSNRDSNTPSYWRLYYSIQSTLIAHSTPDYQTLTKALADELYKTYSETIKDIT